MPTPFQPMIAAAARQAVVVVTRPEREPFTARLRYWPNLEPAAGQKRRRKAVVVLASGAFLSTETDTITLADTAPAVLDGAA